MPRVPVIGRLTFREYVGIFVGSLFIVLETILTTIIGFLPKPVIQWFYNRSRSIFHAFVGPPEPKSHKQHFAERIRRAPDFERLCEIFGYTFEEHVVLTKDGYLLGLHRLPFRKGEQRVGRGSSTGKPVVYLHHGLLMNSEVWVCLTDPERSYALRLVELGYDVWLGNSRGNKYSKKSVHYNPNSTRFWDYSIDEFAWHDIPDSIEYILDVTKEPSLSYVGFSQGTAQAFAALSIHPQLNEKVNVFIALAPAMSPAGLAAPIVDGLMKASPTLLYLIFGRKAILTSVPAWQSLLYPPVFDAIITTSLRVLFSWRSERLSPLQKLAAYPHLYSYCSVKSIVHWFQIMRNAKFQMYDDDVQVVARVATRKHRPSGVTSYAPARFPTRNIVTPIVLIYGDADSLVDIDAMMRELPGHTTARKLSGYEHLDILWGEEIDRDVIPFVEEALKNNCVRPERVGKDSKISMNGYLDVATDTDGTSTYGDGDR
ncbi:triacylglycerol lipase [Laetiporus sulphureus 93-53]|uniref:Triacylglycerol lipase n=1 Tax=Laetiporus sulphureus 93-53 TaxID=1314785 RepID=A0A165DF23_9APHY|nr:triacylglycerol lipase [Laetiporus sulphureus 93-53]KZT04749.1 triacylglycerol lipase [Laetiporus sulphureus 93-53]